MKTISTLLLALALPLLARGQGVAVSDAAGWRPMPPTQVEMLRKQAAQQGGRLMNASVCDTGSATLLGVPRQGVFSQLENNTFLTGFIHGVEGSGPKVVTQAPVVFQALKGTAITFQGRAASGQDLTLLSYVLFGSRETYTLLMYGHNLTQTDPMVLSYLARLKVDPAAIPRGVDTSSAFELGQIAGRILFWMVLAAFVVWGLSRVIGRSHKHRDGLRPPPLDPPL